MHYKANLTHTLYESPESKINDIAFEQRAHKNFHLQPRNETSRRLQVDIKMEQHRNPHNLLVLINSQTIISLDLPKMHHNKSEKAISPLNITRHQVSDKFLTKASSIASLNRVIYVSETERGIFKIQEATLNNTTSYLEPEPMLQFYNVQGITNIWVVKLNARNICQGIALMMVIIANVIMM